jgi:hypothetical protein
MLRASVLRHHGLRYDPAFRAAQDFDLWTRLVRVTDAAILADVCLHYRRHSQATSTARREAQEAARVHLMRRELRALIGAELSETGLVALGQLFTPYDPEPELVGDYTAAARTIADAFHAFMRERAIGKGAELNQVTADAAQILRFAASIAARHSFHDALLTALQIRRVSPRRLVSPSTLRCLLPLRAG